MGRPGAGPCGLFARRGVGGCFSRSRRKMTNPFWVWRRHIGLFYATLDRMERESNGEPRLSRVMVAGFALLILLLIASTYIGITAIRSTESNTARLLEEQRVMLRLIDDIQQEENSLSAVFYELATGRAENRQDLLNRLTAMEDDIRRNIKAGLASGNMERWTDVTAHVEALISEGRKTRQ